MYAAWIIIFMINSFFFVDHKTVEEILETIDDTVLGMSLINIYQIAKNFPRSPIFMDNQ